MARGDNLRSYYYRFTVEDCLTLTLGQLNTIKSKEFREFTLSEATEEFSRSTLEFYQSGELKGKIFSVIRREINGIKLILRSSYNHEIIEQRIHLSNQKLYYGGLKHYLHCPSCGRRCSKLYLIPNRHRFMCRSCGDLTYRSCKTSEGITNFERFTAQMANISVWEAKLFSNCLRKSAREDLLTHIVEKPYSEEIPMHQISLKLGTRQMQELNNLSKKKDIPRSELIRRSIDLYLAGEIERELKAKQLNADTE